MCRKRNWEGDWMHSGPSLPLPELQFLSLAANKVCRTQHDWLLWKTSVSLLFYPQISQEEALLAVAVFPAIRELDICSNPLISQRIRNSNGALSFSFFSAPSPEFCNLPYVSCRRPPLPDPVPPAQTGNRSQEQLAASHKSATQTVWSSKTEGRPCFTSSSRVH